MSSIAAMNTLVNFDGALLGEPRSKERSTRGKLGRYQEYSDGMIIYHPSYGACVLTRSVFKKWMSASVSATNAHNGHTIREFLGFPTNSTYKTSDGSEVCMFERGTIICRANGDAYVVFGEVYEKYLGSAGSGMAVNFPSWMGYPTADVVALNADQLFGAFEHADIHWHKNHGAFTIHGGIRDKYNVIGASTYGFGNLLTDETDIVHNGAVVGKSSQFEYGVIIWRAGIGAYALKGDIYGFYSKATGGIMNAAEFDYGFPTSDMKRSSNGKYVYNNFQNGILVCETATKTVSKINELTLRVSRIESTNEADETSDDDPYLVIKLTPSIAIAGLPSQFSIPNERSIGEDIKKGGDGIYYYNGKTNFDLDAADQIVCKIPIRDGAIKLDVEIETWDWDDGLNFANNLFARCKGSYDINTMWDTAGSAAVLDYTSTENNNEKARIIFNFDPMVKIDKDDFVNFRKNLWWNIDNYGVPRFSRRIFAQTFSDVDENEFPLFHPFNAIFFEAVYKGLGANGVCFGMSAEAVYALKRRSVSTQFISKLQYSDHTDGRYGKDPKGKPLPDPVRNESFQVKHGYQIGSELVRYYVSQFADGEVWNPVKSFYRARDMFASGDIPVMVLSESAVGFSSGGHAVVPYHFDDSDPNRLLIYICDPNKPVLESLEYNHAQNIIVINRTAGAEEFVFMLDGTKNWTGRNGLFKGGRMFPVPYSMFSNQPKTPAAEVGLALLALTPLLLLGGPILVPLGLMAGLFGGALFVCGSGATTGQITDSRGNTYLNDDGSVNYSPDGGIDRFMHIAPLGQPSDMSPNFFVREMYAYPDSILVEDGEDDLAWRTNWMPSHMAIAARSESFWPSADLQNLRSIVDATDYRNSVHVCEMMGNQRSMVFEQSGNKYEWAFATREVKYALEIASSNIDETSHSGRGRHSEHLEPRPDRIAIDGLAMAGQALTFSPSQDKGPAQFSATIVNNNNHVRFQFSNAEIAAGSNLTFQHDNGGRKIFVYNGAAPVSLDLSAMNRSNPEEGVGLKSVSLGADTITSFELLGTSALTIEKFDQIGSEPTSSETLSNIAIDCAGLAHYWLVLLDSVSGEVFASTNPPRDRPDSGGWFYSKDRSTKFLLKDGTYNLTVQSGTLSIVFFEVKAGVISYDPNLEGIVSGSGTNTLNVHGCEITVDATGSDNDLIFLPGPNGFGGDHFTNLSGQRTILRLLPTANTSEDGWQYYFTIASAVIASFTFRILPNGLLDFESSFEPNVTGMGTTELIITKLIPR
jgi:LGFP repeat